MTAQGPEDDDRAIGLLDRIAESALDDDYYLVRPEPHTRVDRVLTGVALGVFAMLITIAAVQTRTDRPATEREQQALATDVDTRRAAEADKRRQLGALRDEVADLSASADRNDPALEALAASTGSSAVRGPGVVLTVTPVADDNGRGDVSDTDLQTLVNALWFLGAEAVSINDQRIGSMTSIRTAGAAVTVNYESLAPPYVIQAIGDGSTMRDAFTSSDLGRSWRDRADDTGLRFVVDTEDELRLPAVDPRRQLVTDAAVAEEAAR